MTSNTPSPTLADLQNKWDAELKASYSKHLWMAFVTAAVIIPFGVWLLKDVVGWELALAAGVVHLLSVPFIARIPARMALGPRPTQRSFDENRQIREALHGRKGKLDEGEDIAVVVRANDPF